MIGIMQGRLSQKGERLQCFPKHTWKEEFEIAAEIGFDTIEWVFEYEDFIQNPLWTTHGRQEMAKASGSNGVMVKSLCAHFFIDHVLQDNTEVLKTLVANSGKAKVETVLLPLLEKASIIPQPARKAAVEAIVTCLPELEKHNITLGLETDLPSEAVAELVGSINHPLVGAYYDTGNSTSQGADIERDVVPLLDILVGVHIKDRAVGGPNCTLGTGDANFSGFFKTLKDYGYEGDFVSEHWFDDPLIAGRHSFEFISGWTNP